MQDYRIEPASGQPPKTLVVLLHGYGSNGQDLISLAPYWQRHLPDTAFVSMDAPFLCEAGMGYQWFSLQDYTPEALLKGAQTAAPHLDKFVDNLLKDYDLPAEKLALAGFSQGTMMALYAGLRRSPPIAGVLGYSGALIGAESLPEDGGKPPVMLIHGETDSVVPVEAWHQAQEILKARGYNLSGHTTPNLEHSIDMHGIEKGGEFLKSVLV